MKWSIPKTNASRFYFILKLSIIFWVSGCTSFFAEDTATSPSQQITLTPTKESIVAPTNTIPLGPSTVVSIIDTPTVELQTHAPESTLTVTPLATPLPSATLPMADGLLKVEELQFIGGRRLALSADGALIATAGLTNSIGLTSTINTIRIYDLNQRNLVQVLEVPVAPTIGTNALTFSPDASLVAAAGLEKVVFVWDVDTGELIHDFPFSDVVFGTSFSSDGEFLAATAPGEIGSIVVWDLDSGESFEFPETISGINVVFVPNTTMLAIVLANPNPTLFGEGVVLIWNFQNGETEIIFHGQAGEGIAVSADGSILAAKIDGYVRMWDLENSREIDVEKRDSDFGLVRMVFSEQGTLATLDPGNTMGLISIWNLEGELLSQMEEEGVLDIAFDPKGCLFVSRPGSLITIWKVSSWVFLHIPQNSILATIPF